MTDDIDLLGDYAVFTSHTRDRYRRLEKRTQFIREQIFEGRGSPGSLARYKAELSALEWAMRVIMKYYKEHPHEDDFLKPTPDPFERIIEKLEYKVTHGILRVQREAFAQVLDIVREERGGK